MIDTLVLIAGYAASFIAVITLLVFGHELGHYLVARWNGVWVRVFSIGFGPELIGWNDRLGTRWKISMIPLGGYIQMLDEKDLESDALVQLRAKNSAAFDHLMRTEGFHHKTLWQRAAIVVAGPLANFILAFFLLAILYATFGQSYTPARVGVVVEGGAAEAAGVTPGDVIVDIGGKTIERMEEVQEVVRTNPDRRLQFTLKRDGENIRLAIVPRSFEVSAPSGMTYTIGRIGIVGEEKKRIRRNPAVAFALGVTETWRMTDLILATLGEIVTGDRGADQLSGPAGIAMLSGDIMASGISNLLWFMAFLSVNLGLLNLLPVPILDGGHLVFLGIEAVRGRRLSEKAEQKSMQVGVALLLALVIFATANDLLRLGLF